MKMKIFTVLLLFVSQTFFAQTTIKHGQEVFGTWKKTQSPYIIEGEAIVPAGKTLKIKKGVKLMFQTGTYRDYRLDGVINPGFNVGFLRVNGKIIAEGSKSERIMFSRNGSGNWGNVFIDTDEKDNVFKYCVFEYGYYIRGITELDNATGALSFYGSSGTVEFCTFRNNGWTAINCKQNANPFIKNVTIVGNNYGVECNSNSVPVISNAIIWDNNTALYINGSAVPEFSYSLIQNYSLEYAYDKGNNIFGKNPGFLNSYNNDYSLINDSPCKKSGKNGSDMGAE